MWEIVCSTDWTIVKCMLLEKNYMQKKGPKKKKNAGKLSKIKRENKQK